MDEKHQTPFSKCKDIVNQVSKRLHAQLLDNFEVQSRKNYCHCANEDVEVNFFYDFHNEISVSYYFEPTSYLANIMKQDGKYSPIIFGIIEQVIYNMKLNRDYMANTLNNNIRTMRFLDISLVKPTEEIVDEIVEDCNRRLEEAQAIYAEIESFVKKNEYLLGLAEAK